MEVEEIIGKLGFGRYQLFITGIAYLATVFCAMYAVQDSFINYTPDYRCYVPSCEDEEALYNQPHLNYTIPPDDDTWSKCEAYNTNDTTELTSGLKYPLSLLEYNGNNDLSTQDPYNECLPKYFDKDDSIKCPNGYIYDRELFKSSTTMDFDLTCDRAYLASFTTSAYTLGMFFGSFGVGLISDTFGRKIAFMIGFTFQFVGAVLCAFSVGPINSIFTRMITGIGGVAVFNVAFVISVEFMPVKHRSLVGLFINISFAFGEALVGVYAIFLREWRALQLVIVLPSIIFFSYYWLLPESIRWLISKKKYDRAEALVNKIASVNKVPPPEFNFEKAPAASEDEKANEPKTNFWHLLRTPNMRKRTLNMYYIWVAVNMVYYGLSQNTGNLGGNIFVNFIATMLIEIPSYIFVGIIFDRIGHKTSLALTLAIAAVSCLGCSFLSHDSETAIVSLSLIGKFGAAGAYSIIYVYASEIFPTEYRSVGVGSCSMFARFGGILSPMVASLGLEHPSLPLLIFGLLASLSLVCTLFLPETGGAALPQTLAESEAFGSDQPMFNFFTCCGHKNTDDAVSDSSSEGKKSRTPSSSIIHMKE